MAYLPFYITPEELALKQKKQEQQFYEGDNVQTWKKYDVEESFRYKFLCLSIAPVIPFLIFTFFVGFWDGSWLQHFASICVVLFIFSISYVTLGLDFKYNYTFSDKGFIVKKRRNIPKWMNTATQVVGWFGIVVCIFMVLSVGPIAFLGAGGFILLSFGLIKRRPDEITEIKVGEREDWLFAYYNKKRKVIRFYHKYDECSKRDLKKNTVFRAQTRGYSYIFFRTIQDLDAMLETLSNKYGIECIDFPDHKAFFEGRPEPRIEYIPSRSLEFPVADTFDLRAQNAPLPEWRRIYNGKWQTESEIERLKAAGEQQTTPAS
ncbi:hypothetical protein [Vibrio hyugaensis]|uniref:hypothetical protein n=1 Tax=Vibrio hyugaensis TaxID=1534743 RepID=UPI000CE416EC|nr:hypothetical protein [Vibrio hyugaensis]